jgi:TrmH family RNA methyltransferase
LLEPSLPENIGSVARAMGHFGLRELVITGPLDPCDARAIALAAGHEGILEQARRAPDVETALAGCTLVVGTTARPQDGIARRVLDPEAAAAVAALTAPGQPLALVFGPEKRGMRNRELQRCDQLVTIPGEPGTCLNLAQAAAVLFHAWYQAAHAQEVSLNSLAAEHQVDSLASHLIALLESQRLVKSQERDSKLHTLRRIVSRTQLTPPEAAMLASWLQALQRSTLATRAVSSDPL